jgi:phage terminase small subunit
VAQKKLTSKEESFAQAYIFNKNDSIEAYRNSDYSQELKPEQMSVQAYKLLKKPHISLRIEQLQLKASQVAEKEFTITVKQRLEWLKKITEAGIATYLDSSGAQRREGLTAARGAIETMNTMLGIKEDKDKKIEPIKIGIVDAS